MNYLSFMYMCQYKACTWAFLSLKQILKKWTKATENIGIGTYLTVFNSNSQSLHKSVLNIFYWESPYKKRQFFVRPTGRKPTQWNQTQIILLFFVTKSFNCTNKKNSLLKSKKLNAKFSFTRNCIKNVSFTKKARQNFQIFFGVILPFFCCQ